MSALNPVHKVTFYPVGNGDTSQIILDNGKRLLFDFRHLKKTESGNGPEINLAKQLRDELKTAEHDSFDVVAFTHSDKDHIENSTDFFELKYAAKYHGDDRIKIKELWVPAAMILETATNSQQSSEFVIWRQEARYRLKQGEGIRVFSKPARLKQWLEDNGMTLESRLHLITDAGQLVPGFTRYSDGVEFFCHSPFVKHVGSDEIARNEASLIFNVRFEILSSSYDYLAIGDTDWSVIEDIVQISKDHKNEDRLKWDLFNIPHHCSAHALSDDKGMEETEPQPLVEELLLHGQRGAFLVSSSDPVEETKAALEQKYPPHLQAKRCYKRYLARVEGCKFLVTMEEPHRGQPRPLTFHIDSNGIKLATVVASGVGLIASVPSPRAG